MTVYFSKNHDVESRATNQLSTSDLSQSQTLYTQDTVAKAERSLVENMTHSSWNHVTLPAPKSIMPENDLMILARAFCKAYSSMSQSVTTQVRDYTKLQQLDETEAKAVLESTTNAINKENAA